MSKPRIILAETDTTYLFPLQAKLAGEFFEKIELEIITDKTYFTELFSSPQRVDVLIVSEDLFDPSLRKHNIGKIFLLTERNEAEQTEDLGIDRIFKYTSVEEVFSEIVGKSREALDFAPKAKKATQIILVCSASGGVGKTTVALGLSTCLTKSYQKVLYLNAGYLQAFQHLLENPAPITAAEVYTELAAAGKIDYNGIKYVIRKEGFSYLPPFKAALTSLGLPFSIFEKIALDAAKAKDYDYIVIDADTVFDEDKTRLMDIADRVLIVTRQNRASVFATNLLVSGISGVNSEKYVVVCNDFDKEQENALFSSDLSLKFTVSEYIGHDRDCGRWKAGSLNRLPGIQKVMFLIL